MIGSRGQYWIINIPISILKTNFFHLSSEQRNGRRRVHLRGTHNFRDLGGYSGAEGRRLRWRVIYRSDHLASLKKSGLEHLNSLGLHTIVDFRSEGERERQPDRLPPGADIQIIELPLTNPAYPNAHVELGERIRDSNIEGLDSHEIILADYKRLATTHTPEIRQFMDNLLEAKGQPLLFHCTAGKDRTGFAAAITLRLLGVPEETILEDYLLSNDYTRWLRWMILTYLRLSRGKGVADFARPLSVARPQYLKAAFDALEAEYGSFDEYTHTGLGWGEEQVKQLKNHLLEA